MFPFVSPIIFSSYGALSPQNRQSSPIPTVTLACSTCLRRPIPTFNRIFVPLSACFHLAYRPGVNFAPHIFPKLFLYIFSLRQSFGPRGAACISARPPDSPSAASHAAYSTAAGAPIRISPSPTQRSPAPQSRHSQLAAVPTSRRQAERERAERGEPSPKS